MAGVYISWAILAAISGTLSAPAACAPLSAGRDDPPAEPLHLCPRRRPASCRRAARLRPQAAFRIPIDLIDARDVRLA